MESPQWHRARSHSQDLQGLVLVVSVGLRSPHSRWNHLNGIELGPTGAHGVHAAACFALIPNSDVKLGAAGRGDYPYQPRVRNASSKRVSSPASAGTRLAFSPSRPPSPTMGRPSSHSTICPEACGSSARGTTSQQPPVEHSRWPSPSMRASACAQHPSRSWPAGAFNRRTNGFTI